MATGVHTRLDYRPMPTEKVSPVFFVSWASLAHKANYVFVDSKPAFISVRHHARRIL
jgi:hypothetical protein